MSMIAQPAPTHQSPTPGNVFDDLRLTRPDGSEYWSARDLMPALGYSKWENAQSAIARAVDACDNSDQDSADHFPAARKMIAAGKGATREVLDYHLTRYAAYLTAMNSDPAKGQVALAQTYFAAQTRAAEVQQALTLADMDDPILAQLAALAQVRRAQLAVEARVEAQEQQLTAVRAELDQSPILGAQLGTLHRLGQQLGQLMGSYRRAWTLFNDRFGLASYRDLPRASYDEAVRFLRAQIAAYSGQSILGGEA